ncbi:glycosyltransferase [Candidatus Woesearchaeota archaeon]|nr:glycosyltransferase [Candidatus Woesearchaeota archaeon]
MTPEEITLFVYNVALLPVIFFSVLFIVLSFINLFMVKNNTRRYPKFGSLPFISVQIPTYNDPIAVRCVKQCMDFDYPKDRFEIIIADDSTNLETQKLLKQFEDKNPGFIKYIHRENREGFKPGALKNAMKITRGDILVIFDADWIPRNDFLRKIVSPFSDPDVAIVQSRQGFYNKGSNLITRFAAYLLMIYHTIILPINNRINCVFFCGTAGAIRRSAFERAGGWNLNSITEDSDLSLKLLSLGYKSVYLPFETPSEVPDTFESFLRQQMRWCYGNARIFFDNASMILFRRGLSLRQRLMVIYVTVGNIAAPIVLVMTLFGFAGWFLGEPTLFNMMDFVDLLSRFAFTAGFLVMGIIALHKQRLLKEFGYLLLSSFTMGLILAVANTVAFTRAVFNKGLHWYCTPKIANESIMIK